MNQLVAIIPAPAGLVSSRDGSPIIAFVVRASQAPGEDLQIETPLAIDRDGPAVALQWSEYVQRGQLCSPATLPGLTGEHPKTASDPLGLGPDRFAFKEPQPQFEDPIGRDSAWRDDYAEPQKPGPYDDVPTNRARG